MAAAMLIKITTTLVLDKNMENTAASAIRTMRGPFSPKRKSPISFLPRKAVMTSHAPRFLLFQQAASFGTVAYVQSFHTSGQYPTVACFPLRTIGVFKSRGSSSSFSSLSSS